MELVTTNFLFQSIRRIIPSTTEHMLFGALILHLIFTIKISFVCFGTEIRIKIFDEDFEDKRAEEKGWRRE